MGELHTGAHERRKTAKAQPDETAPTHLGENERTVTISGTAVIGTALILLVIGAGFVTGRRALGSPGAEDAQGYAGALDAPPVRQAAIATPVNVPQAIPVPTGAVLPVGPGGEIAPGTVLDLGDTNHPLVGQPIIEIEGALLDGQRVKLTDYLGQAIAVNFWATWCPPCRIEMPWLEEAYNKHKGEGFVIVAVNAGERVPASQVHETVERYVTSAGLTFPILMPDDPYTPQRQYRVLGLPSTYLVNREGIVVAVHRGMFPNRVTLEDRLQRILAPVEPDS